MTTTDAFSEGMAYLELNLPSFDVINKVSLGFDEAKDLPDGLNSGVASVGVNSAL